MNDKVSNWLHRFNKWFYSSNFDHLNQQSYIRLSTSFQNIDKQGPTVPYIEQQLEKLKNQPDWNTAKSIELLLIPLLKECDLDIELRHQLHKAATLFNAQEYEFFSNEFDKISDGDALSQERKRALLNKLTATIHKLYEDRQLRSLFANKARLKIGFFFSLSILFSVFLLTIGILNPDGIYQYCARYCPEFQWVNSLTSDIADTSEAQHIDKIHLHYAITSLMAGYMGACFSMLISLKGRVESISLQEMDNLHSLHFILTRIITGIGAALICYYFFRAEILSGSLFPDFSQKQEISLNSQTFFTLIIWCFLAGFSEKLVPSILSSTEAQIDKKK